jgi:hypothetical protein
MMLHNVDVLLNQTAEEQARVGNCEAWTITSEYLVVVEVIELARVSARAKSEA